MEDIHDDAGHRYGNFPNYYDFHNVHDRLDVLTDEVLTNLLKTAGHCAAANSAGDTSFNILDVGSNDGSLTIALHHRVARLLRDLRAESLSSSLPITVRTLGMELDPRLVSRSRERLKHAKADDGAEGCDSSATLGTMTDDPSSSVSSSSNITTLSSLSSSETAMASSIQSPLSPPSTASSSDTLMPKGDSTDRIGLLHGDKIRFEALDATNTPRFREVIKSFLSSTTKDSAGVDRTCVKTLRPAVHLVTCFSTTMWVHVNLGDDGLHLFLGELANAADVALVVEPQPWRCYRSAVQRLRRQGKPPLAAFEHLAANNHEGRNLYVSSPCTHTDTATSGPTVPSPPLSLPPEIAIAGDKEVENHIIRAVLYKNRFPAMSEGGDVGGNVTSTNGKVIAREEGRGAGGRSRGEERGGESSARTSTTGSITATAPLEAVTGVGSTAPLKGIALREAQRAAKRKLKQSRGRLKSMETDSSASPGTQSPLALGSIAIQRDQGNTTGILRAHDEVGSNELISGLYHNSSFPFEVTELSSSAGSWRRKIILFRRKISIALSK